MIVYPKAVRILIPVFLSCVLAHLEPSSARKLLRKVRVDILDWFVSRRYLPTSNDLDKERCLRRMTFTSLRSVSKQISPKHFRIKNTHEFSSLMAIYVGGIFFLFDSAQFSKIGEKIHLKP